MSENKKYFYLKVKDNFFDSEEMKILESQKNGEKYQLLYLKLCLLSAKNNGALLFNELIPYDLNMISTVIRVDFDTVKTGLELLEKLGLVAITDNNTIYMTTIQSLVGNSNTEADRKRAYRERLKNNAGHLGGQLSENRTPETELKTDIELNKDIENKELQSNDCDTSLTHKRAPVQVWSEELNCYVDYVNPSNKKKIIEENNLHFSVSQSPLSLENQIKKNTTDKKATVKKIAEKLDGLEDVKNFFYEKYREYTGVNFIITGNVINNIKFLIKNLGKDETIRRIENYIQLCKKDSFYGNALSWQGFMSNYQKPLIVNPNSKALNHNSENNQESGFTDF